MGATSGLARLSSVPWAISVRYTGHSWNGSQTSVSSKGNRKPAGITPTTV